MTEIWQEPAYGDLIDAETYDLAGLERLQPFRHAGGKIPPLCHFFGFAVSEARAGSITSTSPVSGWLQHNTGWIDTAFVADAAMGTAVQTVLPPGMVHDTMQLHVTYVRTATLDAITFVGKAKTVHMGRSHAIAEVEVLDSNGRLLTHAVGRYGIRPFDPARRAPQPATAPATSLPDPYLRPPVGRVFTPEQWAKLSGSDIGGLVDKANAGPMAHFTGLRFQEGPNPGELVIKMPVTAWLLTNDGVVLKGALGPVAQGAIFGVLRSLAERGSYSRTADVRLDFFTDIPADGNQVTATAQVVHLDEGSAVGTSEVRDGGGRLIAFATMRTVGIPAERLATPPRRDRHDAVLATVMFTDIVGSTEVASQLGDARWGEVLEQHHAIVREQLERFSGTEVRVTGDGFLASFESPAKAIRCGRAIAALVPRIGLEVRTGIHAGECEVLDGDLGGIAVHIGARVMAAAAAREVIVSSTVRDLVAGSDFRFNDRGIHELKGVDGDWRLYAVEAE